MNKNVKEPETVIIDCQGRIHDAYYCDGCYGACPYWVTDAYGKMACFADMYHTCNEA
jgi:hypothetical protein